MLDWLLPQTVEIVSSPINGKIKVIKTRGRYSVWVGGFQQSGPLVEKVWQKGLKSIATNPKDVLILGLGCGTVVKLIYKNWPAAKVTGIEIDPVMISLGKKYFGLDTVSNLKIIKADANKYIGTLISKKRGFDLVIWDVFLGDQSLLQSKKLLKIGRVIVVNKLRLKDIKGKARGQELDIDFNRLTIWKGAV